MDSRVLLTLLINVKTIKAGWRDALLPLWNFRRSNKQKIRYQLALNKTFCPTTPLFSHRQLNHPHKTKINKIILSATTHRFFTQRSQYQNWKANKNFILTLIELGCQCRSSLLRSQNFMPQLILKKHFIERELKISKP